MKIISHFFNESYLLPFWLNHHKKIFDSGVLINHNSTDNSIKLIEKITPSWDLHNYKEKEFDSEKLNHMVQKYEKKIRRQYKIVLNTTEFLIINDGEKFNKLVSRKGKNCFRFVSKIMIDEDVSKNKINDLLKEKKFGIWNDEILDKIDLQKISDEKVIKYVKALPQRYRFMHNYKHGKYLPGRHSSKLKFEDVNREVAYIQYYLLSPMNNEFIKRKTQISEKVSTDDKQKDRGYQHLYSDNDLVNAHKKISKSLKV